MIALAVVVGINLISLHAQSGYETFTPGAYVRYGEEAFVSAGAYRNSEAKLSTHAGVGYEWRFGQWGVGGSVGVVTGYQRSVQPYIFPSVSYRFESFVGRLILAPPSDPKSSAALSFAVEF